ncbi:MAG: hypothetical protein V4543_03415 [Bacteroidota bacterium]
MTTINFISSCPDIEILNDVLFGIIDPGGRAPAKISRLASEIWVATIVNSLGVEIIFAPIDNCAYFNNYRKAADRVNKLGTQPEKEKQCDCILAYTGSIIFIELKSSQLNGAIEQLLQTVKYFATNSQLADIPNKTAYAIRPTREYIAKGATSGYKEKLNTYGVLLKEKAPIVIS